MATVRHIYKVTGIYVGYSDAGVLAKVRQVGWFQFGCYSSLFFHSLVLVMLIGFDWFSFIVYWFLNGLGLFIYVIHICMYLLTP